MIERVARYADADVRLVGLLVVDLHARPVGLDLRVRRLTRVGRGQVAEQLLDLGHGVAADVAPEPDDHSLWLVPAPRVAEEGVSVGCADRLLSPDDVPPKRLVAVKKLLIHAA